MPALQLNGNNIVDGILPSSLRLGPSSDSLGLMNSELGASEHLMVSGSQLDKSISLSVSLQEAGMVKGVSKGMNVDLEVNPTSDANYETNKSMDSDNENMHDPLFLNAKEFLCLRRGSLNPSRRVIWF